MTDRAHKTGFRWQADILKHLFDLVVANQVPVPLFDTTAAGAEAFPDNVTFLQHHFAGLLRESFSHLAPATIEVSTSILARRTAPSPPFIILYRVPHGCAPRS